MEHELGIEIEQSPKMPEEDAFQKGKKEQIENEKKNADTSKPSASQTGEKSKQEARIRGVLGTIIIGAANPILKQRGYEPYTAEQQAQIIEAASAVEDKHNIKASPEVALAAAVAIPIVTQVMEKRMGGLGKIPQKNGVKHAIKPESKAGDDMEDITRINPVPSTGEAIHGG